MQEIEVGEYVRTKKGYIAKVIDYKDELICDKTIDKSNEENILKHSKNIIDLIEVGDYVNGREVKHIAIFEGFPDYPKLIFVDEKHLVPGDTAENKDIKLILTKEQIAGIEYKI